MAKVVPFRAIRPVKEKAHLISSRSVDSYSTDALAKELSENEISFLHVINPDFEDKKSTKPGSLERLKKTKQKYQTFLKKELFVQDAEPAFYLYQQTANDHSYTGIIACASIDDYFSDVIKKHEHTLTEREKKLKEYLEVCDFNAEPVLFAYPNNQVIDSIMESTSNKKPDYDFVTNDTLSHKLWIISEKELVLELSNAFEKIPAIYIADGHHRSASSSLLGLSKRRENPDYTGREPFNFYLGIFFPETQLKIFDFNRVVKDLNGLSVEELLKKLSASFEVEKKSNELYSPKGFHNIAMYVDNCWYSLTAKKEIISNINIVNELDVSILSNYVLDPILGIKDLKTDKRISFVSGIKGISELKKLVDEGIMSVAFALYPISMDQLKKIANQNGVMPPKSTWVEPKLRSALTIYSLS